MQYDFKMKKLPATVSYLWIFYWKKPHYY